MMSVKIREKRVIGGKAPSRSPSRAPRGRERLIRKQEKAMSSTVSSPPERATRFLVCPRCRKRRKMQVLRAVDETALEWTNCGACNALVCFTYDADSDSVALAQDVGDFGAPAPDEFRTYVPEQSYEVGEFIYHQTWRDVGKVIRRRDLAGGRAAIDVAFLNYGPKMLIVEAEALAR
jgi:hypothetical protein